VGTNRESARKQSTGARPQMILSLVPNPSVEGEANGAKFMDSPDSMLGIVHKTMASRIIDRRNAVLHDFFL
jgi:hypothetical protein